MQHPCDVVSFLLFLFVGRVNVQGQAHKRKKKKDETAYNRSHFFFCVRSIDWPLVSVWRPERCLGIKDMPPGKGSVTHFAFSCRGILDSYKFLKEMRFRGTRPVTHTRLTRQKETPSVWQETHFSSSHILGSVQALSLSLYVGPELPRMEKKSKRLASFLCDNILGKHKRNSLIREYCQHREWTGISLLPFLLFFFLYYPAWRKFLFPLICCDRPDN